MIDPQWWVSCVVDSVDHEKHMLTLWISGWEQMPTTPIVDVMPRWLLYPEVSFQVYIPEFCEENQTLDGVVWRDFQTTGMEMQSEFESLWSLGRINAEDQEEVSQQAVTCALSSLEDLFVTIAEICWQHYWTIREVDLQTRFIDFEHALTMACDALPDGWHRKGFVFNARPDCIAERFFMCERATLLLARAIVETYPGMADFVQAALDYYRSRRISPLREE